MFYHLAVKRKQKELEKNLGQSFPIPIYFRPRIPVITNNELEKIQMLTWGLIPYPASEMDAHTISKLVITKVIDHNVPESIGKFEYKGLEKNII